MKPSKLPKLPRSEMSPVLLLEESFPAVVVFDEQLTLTNPMLKALIGWIHHTRDDQLDECHCGMPPYLTQSEYDKLQFGAVPLLCLKKSRDNLPSL
jgi:hypothetical protein